MFPADLVGSIVLLVERSVAEPTAGRTGVLIEEEALLIMPRCNYTAT